MSSVKPFLHTFEGGLDGRLPEAGRNFMRTQWTLRVLPAALLLAQAGLLAYGAAVHSPSIDEVGHMAAGLSHWQLGRFDLYNVNPPLVRMAATFPVLWADPKTDWADYSDEPGAPVGVRPWPPIHFR